MNFRIFKRDTSQPQNHTNNERNLRLYPMASSLLNPKASQFAATFHHSCLIFEVFYSCRISSHERVNPITKGGLSEKKTYWQSNCERWKSWKCQEKWHITMTTQLLSHQGCSAWSVATKWDRDCCSPSGVIAINRLFSTSHCSTLKLNWLIPWNCSAENQSGIISFPPLESKVLPNTVKEFILFMSSRFTQGHQRGPDSLMA